jgi:hypothetical protein
MAAPSVVPETQSDKHLRFRPRSEHRARLGKISKATELRLINTDPDHPQPVPMPPGGQVKAYVEAESDAYLQIVLQRARNAIGKGGAK